LITGRTQDYGDGFHDRLSTNWPEPRGQLHAGIVVLLTRAKLIGQKKADGV